MPTQTIQQDLIKELGIDQLPTERQEEILTAMTEALLKRITLRVLENLDEKQREEFDAVASANETEKVTEFLARKVPNYEQLIQDEIAKFRQDMTETVNALIS